MDIFDKAMELPGLRRFRPVWQKHRGVLLYLFFGALTTAVSIGSFALCNRLLAIHELIANVISWVCAVTFAYVTNRKWVFHSQAVTRQEITREILSFFGCRLATGVMDWVIMFVCVDVLGWNDMLIKVISNILVILLNFVASKLIIFKKKK